MAIVVQPQNHLSANPLPLSVPAPAGLCAAWYPAGATFLLDRMHNQGHLLWHRLLGHDVRAKPGVQEAGP